MQDIRVSIVQSDLFWEDKQKNLENFAAKLEKLPPSDLIVLPEMFNTGFSMKASELSETMDDKTVGWMKAKAKQVNSVVAGSLMVKEDGQYYNRFIWMRPDGSHECYDKRHLFRLANETDYFAGGQKRTIVDLKGWRFCLQVCYDLRFPVWSRNIAFENENTNSGNEFIYDVLMYVANWPVPRATAWNTLLRGRAIENISYIVGVNRVGDDGNGMSYSGDSAIIDYKGEKLTSIQPFEEKTETITLSFEELQAFRKKSPFNLDADRIQVLD